MFNFKKIILFFVNIFLFSACDLENDLAEKPALGGDFFKEDGKLDDKAIRYVGELIFVPTNRGPDDFAAKFIYSPVYYSVSGAVIDEISTKIDEIMEDISIETGIHFRKKTDDINIRDVDILFEFVDDQEWTSFRYEKNSFLKSLLAGGALESPVNLNKLVTAESKCTTFIRTGLGDFSRDGSGPPLRYQHKSMVVMNTSSLSKSDEAAAYCLWSNVFRAIGILHTKKFGQSVVSLSEPVPELTALDRLTLRALYSKSMATGQSARQFFYLLREFESEDFQNTGAIAERPKN